MTKKDKILGCIIGGAVGDALGYPVEFVNLEQIKEKFGFVKEYVKVPAEISDDTQMTLFTIEGLLRGENRGQNKGLCDMIAMVRESYKRWLITQGYELKVNRDSYLLQQRELYKIQAPGNACITGIQGAKNNHSKGCGTVMRIAPVGLFFDHEDIVFDYACDISRLTHGHPTGVYSGGAMALLVFYLLQEHSLNEAIEKVLTKLKQYENAEETIEAIESAKIYALSQIPIEQAICELGEGWVAEEALAIGIYCALKFADDFIGGVSTAVNITGDSDSTGAITGNILGVILGVKEIPQYYLDNLSEYKVVEKLANDLYTKHEDSAQWRSEYPGS